MNLSRRVLLGGSASLAAMHGQTRKDGEAYRVRTPEAQIEVTIEFHDGYSSRGFWFGEEMSSRRFCLSADGNEGRNCLSGFRGSLAIARYRVRPRTGARNAVALREYVRDIDHDSRVEHRPPFERTIVLENGVGSDLQAFGYEPAADGDLPPGRHGPWYLYRQDLYLEPHQNPFLILYWKHRLTSIRVLDLIPGEHALVEKK
jgi:hypothetical protein